MKLYIGKRYYGTNKFRWFYTPIFKSTKKANGIIIFWWIGRRWYLSLQRTDGKRVWENGRYIYKRNKD